MILNTCTKTNKVQYSAFSSPVNLERWMIYGASGRIGSQLPPKVTPDSRDLFYSQTAPETTPPSSGSRLLDNKEYEITDHLGNVRVILSDVKMPADISSSRLTVDYTADVINAANYYPYGEEIPQQTWNAAYEFPYLFGYNGMLKDNHIAGEGNAYYTLFREYDPILGRWWSADPLRAKYPDMSPYIAFGANPVMNIDPMGDDWFRDQNSGKVYYQENLTERDLAVVQDGDEGANWVYLGPNNMFMKGPNDTYNSDIEVIKRANTYVVDKDSQTNPTFASFSAEGGKKFLESLNYKRSENDKPFYVKFFQTLFPDAFTISLGTELVASTGTSSYVNLNMAVDDNILEFGLSNFNPTLLLLSLKPVSITMATGPAFGTNNTPITLSFMASWTNGDPNKPGFFETRTENGDWNANISTPFYFQIGYCNSGKINTFSIGPSFGLMPNGGESGFSFGSTYNYTIYNFSKPGKK